MRRWTVIGQEPVRRRDDVGFRTRGDDQFADQMRSAALGGRDPGPSIVEHASEKRRGVLAAKAKTRFAIEIGLRQDRGGSLVIGRMQDVLGRLRNGGGASAGHGRIITRVKNDGNLPCGQAWVEGAGKITALPITSRLANNSNASRQRSSGSAA